ncbi:DUF1800 family protein [Undibacterium flavidum]|uniref:DUF1800 family protein n=1 Tax=Undibacterium flavidum TaxID=2762297 RepID=A0ABR6YHY7_9BURK|nr:DUF1800 family protein [Undibacterium flavidum]MBC3876064.1 DUF1800 family protein [Undibacterium flavidum]
MIALRKAHLRHYFCVFCVALLSACSGQNDAPKTDSPAPIQYQAPPIINTTSASFNGPRSNYTVTISNTEINVIDNVGSDGNNHLATSILLLKFSDISINLGISSKAGTIASADLASLIELYIAYFNRVPDAEGLAYWIDQFKAGMTLDQIGESFYAAAILYSTQTGYSATMSNADFVKIVYKNVLGRPTPDQEGLTYWSQRLDNGTATRGTLVRTMLTSAHTFKGDATYGWVAQLLDNKNIVGKDFAVSQGISYISPLDSITKGMSIAAAVTASDTTVAKGLIDALIGLSISNPTQPSPAQTARFLQQSTFGPNSSDLTAVSNLGFKNWIEAQFNVAQTLHRSYMDTTAATLPKGLSDLNQNHFFESFWQQTVKGDDQLRQRVGFALSQIMVTSFQDSGVANYPRGVASYYDTLNTHAFTNFRQLLEAVSLHPMMGIYLTSLKNQKESGTRVPDENYAREVMQLFTIGLYKLNPDGSYVIENGKPVETYSNADITGLAKVFTGWSWAGPDKTSTRFYGGSADPNRDWLPMQAYPSFHSSSIKSFLGVTIPAQSPANPEASMKIALDTLFNHPNVGPFIGKQLIQRLVTSNPSPQYVARVTAAFNNNGQGERGDMKAMIKAILLDVEARNDPSLSNAGIGKLKEPVLRLASWLRAFSAKSTSGFYRITNLDDPLTGLAQTPMRSPSVFNFYRPGYVPPNSGIADAQLVSPEMQITAETSVVGYLNFMRDIIANGTGSGRDVKPDYSAFTPLATTPDQLVDKVNLLLMANQMSSNLRTQLIAAVNSITIPASPQTAIDTAKLNRVYMSVYLTMASPEYLVQK